MKKVINESVIRNIVKESLLRVLRENDDYGIDPYAEDKSYEDKWADVEDEFYYDNSIEPDEFNRGGFEWPHGNVNRLDRKGLWGMAAQGDPGALTTKIARGAFVHNEDDLDPDFMSDIDMDATQREAEFLEPRFKDSFRDGEDLGYLSESVFREVKRQLRALKEDKDKEIDDMYDEFGNNNIHDTKGRYSMWAQGKKGELATHLGLATRSTGHDSVKAAKEDEFFNLNEADYYDDDDELSTRKRRRSWAGDAKFHDENERRIKELEKGRQQSGKKTRK